MAVTVTNSKISALNTINSITSNAATVDTDGGNEVFTITPSVSTGKLIILIGGTGAAADGNLSYSFAAGDLFGSQAISGTVTKNTEKMIEIEIAKVMKNDGKIYLTLDTVAATDKLLADHAAYVKVIELIA